MKSISIVTEEIKRRQCKAIPSANQLANLKWIKAEYPNYKNLAKLKLLAHNLKIRLDILQKQIKYDLDEKERKSQRNKPA